MKSRKITVTPEVRRLLDELDLAFQCFDEKTAKLAEGRLSDTEAVDLGALRESDRARILGVAYQLNKASTGRDD